MEWMYFPYWGGMVQVKEQAKAPRKGRYLCSDEECDYFDVDADYIVAVPF